MVPIVSEHIAEICTKNVRAYEEYLLLFFSSLHSFMDGLFVHVHHILTIEGIMFLLKGH